MVRRAQAHRRGRPMILLDIAMPRDIDLACGKVDDVYLFDIDDLKQVVGQNYEERRKAAEEAETLIARGVTDFLAWQRTVAVKPVLAGFRGYLNELIEREAQKTLAKEHFRDLTPKQRESLQGLLEAVAAKISGDASRNVLSPPEGHYQEQLADALRALFPETKEQKAPKP
jgi:glutamyl-tRNA reductase